MKVRCQTHIFLSMILLALTLNSASARNSKCVSPTETVTQFYHWYLGEIANGVYPLTPTYTGDKNKLKQWITSSLLRKIQTAQDQSEMDFDYFTDAQDFFDSWPRHISVKRVFQRGAHSEVKLSLGVDSELNVYTIELSNENCWKIKYVRSDR